MGPNLCPKDVRRTMPHDGHSAHSKTKLLLLLTHLDTETLRRVLQGLSTPPATTSYAFHYTKSRSSSANSSNMNALVCIQAINKRQMFLFAVGLAAVP